LQVSDAILRSHLVLVHAVPRAPACPAVPIGLKSIQTIGVLYSVDERRVSIRNFRSNAIEENRVYRVSFPACERNRILYIERKPVEETGILVRENNPVREVSPEAWYPPRTASRIINVSR